MPHLMGEYTKETYEHDKRRVFKHIDGKWFIFFVEETGWIVRTITFVTMKI